MTTNPSRLLRVLSFVGGCLIAGTAAAQTGLPAPKADLGSEVVRVLMDLDTGHPVVHVKINEQGPFRFVFDTGAGGTMVSADLAGRLELPSLGPVLVGDASGNAPKQMELVRIDSIAVGAATFSGQVGIVIKTDHIFDEDDHTDGILAFNTFAECLVTLDYPRSRLVLQHGELPPADGCDILEYKSEFQLPVVSLTVAGVPLDLTIDSGAGVGGVFAAELEGKIPLKAAPVTVAMGRRMNSEMGTRDARVDGDLMLDHPVASRRGVGR